MGQRCEKRMVHDYGTRKGMSMTRMRFCVQDDKDKTRQDGKPGAGPVRVGVVPPVAPPK